MTPRVSVVVPSYNAASYLPDSIESVIAQTYTGWELVIVDDGSTDDTPSVIRPYAERLQDKLRYVYQSNRGLPAARNTGIRNARGEFIALLDADDVYLPSRLERGVALMDSDPEIGLLHARVARIDARNVVVSKPVHRAKYLSGNIAHHVFTRRAHLLCPTILFRKSCVDQVGFFDETMRATEDRDLWFRIAEHYRVGYIDEILAYYRLSPGAMSRDLQRMLTWQLYFVNKYRRRGGVSALAVHQALGNIYRERGDSLISGGELAASIRSYARAVLYYPFNPANMYMLFRAFAEPLVSGVRAAASAARAKHIPTRS
jgi:glycosyltransferase involved in cell wall biosynthesis